MAHERNSPDPHDGAGPSRLAQARAFALAAAAWVREKPRSRSLYVVLPIAAILAAGIAWGLSRGAAAPQDVTLDLLVEALDQGDFLTARAKAEQLESAPAEGERRQGLTLFVRGARLAWEAPTRFDPEEQRNLNRVATGCFQQAREQGLPPELDDRAFLQAAVCLNRAARYAACVQYLEQGLDEGATAGAVIHQLLADGYARLPNPRWDKALEHLDLFLQEADLSPPERQAAGLDRVEILLGLDREQEALQALEPLREEDGPLASRVGLLRAKLLVRQAQPVPATAEGGDPAAGPKRDALTGAMQILEEIREREAIDRPERRQADYLHCVCLRELGDPAEALKQFSAVRRLHAGSPSGLSAGLWEAELFGQLGQDEEALESFQRLLAESPPPQDYSNPWISLDGFRARLLAAYARWTGQQKHAEAIALARAMPPVFPPARAMLLQAEARSEWAKRLEDEAERLAGRDAEPLTEQARRERRLAGIAYARLALLQTTAREYPDAIWRSAQSYLHGRDYRHAARMFALYLEQDGAPHVAEAQLHLGEALMSLGELKDALERFDAVLAYHPEHPAVYRARLLAAQTHLELGDAAAAKAMLRDNLEHEALTPESLEWRDSLFLLGETLYRDGKILEAESRRLGAGDAGPQAPKPALAKLEESHEAYGEAAEVLKEALARYPNAPRTLRSKYFLAEAYREAAKYPRRRLSAIALDATRNAVEREMQADLALAVDAYAGLIDSLTLREKSGELNARAAPLTAVEQRMLRNAFFGRADALFDLGRYAEAIRAYTLAANRYQNEPAALEAFFQIAACHRRLHRPAEARGVLEQAKVVLSRIPPEADFVQATRYGRKQWEELLEVLLLN